MTDDQNDQNEQTGYDPSAHTVPEVTEYLASADADEVTAVKAAESEGQKRKGVLEWEPPKAPEPEAGDTVTLRVSLPFWTDSFTMAKDPADMGNGQYVVTRGGTEVPSDVAETIINRAQAQGVTVEYVDTEGN